MAMKLVALLVILATLGNNFVECTWDLGWGFGPFGHGSDFGFGSGTGSSSSGGGGGTGSSWSWSWSHPGGGETAVVAQDGSGNYQTIKEAIQALQGQSGITIRIKAGVYDENILIPKKMKNLILKGDGKQATIITGNRGDSPSAGSYKLYDSATVAVEGDGFVATGITFRNTAGPKGNQAAAIRVEADEVAFYECTFEGYQDTVYVHSGRHFFKNCDIYGDVDFICGAAAAVFQDCRIILRRPKTENGEITIATSSREDPSAKEGLVFQRCRIVADKDIGEAKIYLGRPWKPYATTVFMQCSIDVPLHPEGWRHWQDGDNYDDRQSERTVTYREYKNKGRGSSIEGRVQWPGFKVNYDEQEMEHFTVQNLLQGDKWIPQTGIPFILGL